MSEVARIEVGPLPIDPSLLPIGTEISSTSFDLPEGVSFKQWQSIGDALLRRHDRDLWMIAGWAAYGDRYRRDDGPALERLYAEQTLYNLGSVYRRVDSYRRRENLSFSHHAEVASLDPELQTVWLDDALRHGWSSKQLREQIQLARGRKASTPALSFKAIGEVYDLCVRAAEKLDMDPGEFARQALEEKARRVLFA